MTIWLDGSDAPDNIDITIIGGAGHVGLPLALAFVNAGLRVLVYDINETTLQTIAGGTMPHLEYDAEPLLEAAVNSDRFFVTSDISKIPGTGAIVITIGTPVDEFLNPVHKVVRQCVDDLLPQLGEGQLIILRSTVYPGTTAWLDRYLKTKGKNVKLTFCPERVVQGHSVKELKEVPHIISGTSPEAVAEAEKIFARLSDKLVHLEPMEAEFAKLFTNAYRYIHFATTNEFHMIASDAGLDYNRIRAGMTEQYPRAQYIPGPGFAAGPCLFKDTAQLAAFATNRFSLGNAAININEGLVLYIIEEMRKRFDLAELTVGLLGMAFKADIDDIRSSLSYKMKKILSLHARQVLTTDAFVQNDPDLLPVEEVIARSDVLVLCTPHSAYRSLDLQGKPVMDVWNFFDSDG
jgi:UDP-N-acetyl-D-mannosaminuronic acid dehydrogenase